MRAAPMFTEMAVPAYLKDMTLNALRHGITSKAAVVSFNVGDLTVNLMRTLRRLRIPTLIFVNKISAGPRSASGPAAD